MLSHQCAAEELAGLSVLLVEDNEPIRRLFSGLLTTRGAVVRGAASAREALALIAEKAPDVLVLDLRLPDESGCALLRKIRALGPEAGGDVPALVLTGAVIGVDPQELRDAGVEELLQKPVTPDQLVASIMRVSAVPR